MKPDLFNFDSFPILGNGPVLEIDSSPKKKIKELLFPVDNCNDVFELLQGRLKDLENSDQINDLDVLRNVPKCDLVLKKVNILGEYYSGKHHIVYYKQDPSIGKNGENDHLLSE